MEHIEITVNCPECKCTMDFSNLAHEQPFSVKCEPNAMKWDIQNTFIVCYLTCYNCKYTMPLHIEMLLNDKDKESTYTELQGGETNFQ